jgi:hypothetical protein
MWVCRAGILFLWKSFLGVIVSVARESSLTFCVQSRELFNRRDARGW